MSDDCDAKTFPQKLMEMLSDSANHDAICWDPSGRAFFVSNRNLFSSTVQPRYFPRISKYSSFTRRLDRWNFQRIGTGPYQGAYMHEHFLRDKPHLVAQIFCVRNQRTKLALGAKSPGSSVGDMPQMKSRVADSTKMAVFSPGATGHLLGTVTSTDRRLFLAAQDLRSKLTERPILSDQVQPLVLSPIDQSSLTHHVRSLSSNLLSGQDAQEQRASDAAATIIASKVIQSSPLLMQQEVLSLQNLQHQLDQLRCNQVAAEMRSLMNSQNSLPTECLVGTQELQRQTLVDRLLVNHFPSDATAASLPGLPRNNAQNQASPTGQNTQTWFL